MSSPRSSANAKLVARGNRIKKGAFLILKGWILPVAQSAARNNGIWGSMYEVATVLGTFHISCCR